MCSMTTVGVTGWRAEMGKSRNYIEGKIIARRSIEYTDISFLCCLGWSEAFGSERRGFLLCFLVLTCLLHCRSGEGSCPEREEEELTSR